MKNVLFDNGGRRSGMERRQFSYKLETVEKVQKG